MDNNKIIAGKGLSSGYVISNPEYKTEMKIQYETPQGKMEIVIPHPPMRYNKDDMYGALGAVIIGLAIKSGIKPKKIGDTDDDN